VAQWRLVPARDAIEFDVHVRPRASTSALAGLHDGVLAVRVAAPPADGQANDAVIALIATTLGVRVSAVEIVRGASSRRKKIRVNGNPASLSARLASVRTTEGMAETT
jgi:uncharacterized protein